MREYEYLGGLSVPFGTRDRRLSCLIERPKEFGMHDYRRDEREAPQRHLDATKRLTEPPRRPVSSRGARPPLLNRHAYSG
jgi:hypothetical protein